MRKMESIYTVYESPIVHRAILLNHNWFTKQNLKGPAKLVFGHEGVVRKTLTF